MTSQPHEIKEKNNGCHAAASTLGEWFAGAAGSAVAGMEQSLARDALANLFGYHIAQIGDHYPRSLLESSRISHRMIIATDVAEHSAGPQLVCVSDALPLDSNALDVLVLPHALDLSRNPHGVLREAERVLIPEGHLVLLGFNPWSWFGLWRLSAGWRGAPPWSGRFYRVARVKDWLTLLGFDVVKVVRGSYRPPLRNVGLHQRLCVVERFGAYFWPVLGNVYLILARKRVEAVRPIRAAWARRERRLATSGMVEPSARRSGRSKPTDENPAGAQGVGI